MVRLLLVLSVSLVAFVQASRADETNPEVNGKKMSEWFQDLQFEKNARLRRVAVVSLGELAQAKRLNFALVRGIATEVGKALKNDSAVSVRAQAIEVLGQLAEIVLEEKNNDPTSVATDLSESLRVEKDVEIQRKVAALLGRFRKFGKPGVQPLTNCLKSPDSLLRQAAAESLGRIGEEARPATEELLKTLADQEKGVRAAGVFALGRLEVDDVNKVALAVLPLLKADPEAEVRQEVPVTLALLNDRTAPVIQALAGGLTDQVAEIRRRSAQALVKMQASAKAVQADVRKAAAEDPDPRVRLDCVRVLVAATADDLKETLPFLMARLDSATEKDPEVRTAVVQELGGLGLDAVVALPALRKTQADPQIKVREAATRAIQSITKAAAPPKK